MSNRTETEKVNDQSSDNLVTQTIDRMLRCNGYDAKQISAIHTNFQPDQIIDKIFGVTRNELIKAINADGPDKVIDRRVKELSLPEPKTSSYWPLNPKKEVEGRGNYKVAKMVATLDQLDQYLR